MALYLISDQNLPPKAIQSSFGHHTAPCLKHTTHAGKETVWEIMSASMQVA